MILKISPSFFVDSLISFKKVGCSTLNNRKDSTFNCIDTLFCVHLTVFFCLCTSHVGTNIFLPQQFFCLYTCHVRTNCLSIFCLSHFFLSHFLPHQFFASAIFSSAIFCLIDFLPQNLY